MPEESTHPPASVPVTDADTDTAPPAESVPAPPAADGVPVNADGVVVDAEGNPVDDGKFLVRLDNFTGPFDLLLQLIGKHKLDVTEVALHQVTDDFIAYIRAMGDDWDLGEASEFLLVAATLLDLKAARLLPAAEVEDEEDLALLEARDLLFARLLQYKAYKEAASHIMELEINGMRRWPRAVSMEPRYAEALPELVLGVGPERLFKLALKQFAPKPGPPEVSIAHIHQVRVSVREHATLLRDRLRRAGHATFTLLVADCDNTLEVVARFLALLELYREGLIDFEQPVSLDELTVRWIGGDASDADLDIDDYEGSKPDPDAPDGESASQGEPTPDDDSASPAERLAGEIDVDDDPRRLNISDSEFDDARAPGDSGDAPSSLHEAVGVGDDLDDVGRWAGASGSEPDGAAGIRDGAGKLDDFGNEPGDAPESLVGSVAVGDDPDGAGASRSQPGAADGLGGSAWALDNSDDVPGDASTSSDEAVGVGDDLGGVGSRAGAARSGSDVLPGSDDDIREVRGPGSEPVDASVVLDEPIAAGTDDRGRDSGSARDDAADAGSARHELDAASRVPGADDPSGVGGEWAVAASEPRAGAARDEPDAAAHVQSADAGDTSGAARGRVGVGGESVTGVGVPDDAGAGRSNLPAGDRGAFGHQAGGGVSGRGETAREPGAAGGELSAAGSAVHRVDVVGESPGSGNAEADDRLDVGRQLDDLGEEDDDARGRA